jgi:alkanesulfonate monooxygenase SsuD/methylene tetrahydromethanopterin reductase-like flavin-dependent oxidoreductase (luciferase family)
MKIGIDSFVAAVPDALTGENLGPADRLKLLLDEIEFADRVGLDVFGVGEHHRAEFLDSIDPTGLATLVVAIFSGAMSLAKAAQSAAPLRTCRREIVRLLP